MQQPQGWVEAEDLLAGLRKEGVRVSRAKLVRLHTEGYLVRPKRVWLGRAAGSASFYDPDTGPRLRVLSTLRRRDRRPERAGWVLWWEGFNLPERFVRPTLQKLLADLDAIGKVASRLGEDDGSDDDAFERACRAFDTVLAWLPKRKAQQLAKQFGFADRRALVKTWIRAISGTLESPADVELQPNMPALQPPVGRPISSAEVADLLVMLSRGIRLPLLRDALSNSTLMDLEYARDELRKYLPIFNPLTTAISQWFAAGVAPQLVGRPFLSLLTPELQQHWFLIWLAYRKHKKVRAFVRLYQSRRMQTWLTLLTSVTA